MDPSEFNHIVDAHADALYRFSLKNIKVIEEAKEIVQNSFEKLWINRNQIPADKAKSYLYTCAHHNIIDTLRKQKRETELDLITHEPQQEMKNESIGLSQIIETALEKLSILQRNAILLRDYEGYSYAEIGQILNINESQVKIQLFRGRKKLQTFLGKLEDLI